MKLALAPILLFDPGRAILPPRPQIDCTVVSSGGQGWPQFLRPSEGLVLDGREHDGTLAVSERRTATKTARHVSPSRRSWWLPSSRSRTLYRSAGTAFGKPIDYLDFATIKLPDPAYLHLCVRSSTSGSRAAWTWACWRAFASDDWVSPGDCVRRRRGGAACAQAEPRHRTAEVRGSIPLGSTN